MAGLLSTALLLCAAAAISQPQSSARGVSLGDACKAGVCGGSAFCVCTLALFQLLDPLTPPPPSVATYPVAPGMRFYSTFNVPGLPLNKTAIETDVTFFIYTNIFFDGGPGQCPSCRMNQFVNQLMLGQPLYGSTGPPSYDPLWMPATTWIFAAQYFSACWGPAASAPL